MLGRLLLLASLLALVNSGATSAPASPQFDDLTFGCLGYYTGGPDPTVAVCERLHPTLKPQLHEARRKWETRNAADIRAVKEACQKRLSRLYRNDDSRIAIAREQARRIQEAMNHELVSDPDANNRVNCRAYIEDYSKGTARTDSLKELVGEIRDGEATLLEWKQ